MQAHIEAKMNEHLIHLKEAHLSDMYRIGKMVFFDRRMEVNEEKTQLMRKEDSEREVLSYNATANGIQAFERLLDLAETRDSGQIERIAQFLAWVWGVKKEISCDFLMSLDRAIGDDMLAVLQAIRWNRISVAYLAVNGHKRIPEALHDWGYDVY